MWDGCKGIVFDEGTNLSDDTSIQKAEDLSAYVLLLVGTGVVFNQTFGSNEVVFNGMLDGVLSISFCWFVIVGGFVAGVSSMT
eukprot:12900988-Ditylum_brightwellii.AAC.1